MAAGVQGRNSPASLAGHMFAQSGFQRQGKALWHLRQRCRCCAGSQANCTEMGGREGSGLGSRQYLIFKWKEIILLLFPKIRKLDQKFPEGLTNFKILKCKSSSNNLVCCWCLGLVFKQSKTAWETGGWWEVEAAGKVIMVMLCGQKVQDFTQKCAHQNSRICFERTCFHLTL